MVKSKQNKIKLVQKFFSYNQNKVEIDCKQAFFSFVYFFPNSLFTVKQKRIVLFLWLKLKLLKSPTTLDFKSVFKKWSQVKIGFVFFCLHFYKSLVYMQTKEDFEIFSDQIWSYCIPKQLFSSNIVSETKISPDMHLFFFCLQFHKSLVYR